MAFNDTYEDFEQAQESVIERLHQDFDTTESLPNLSQLIDEKFSMETFLWEAFTKPKRKNQILRTLEMKKRRLEHCVNIIAEDEFCEEHGKFYIKSPGKENWYLDMEKDDMDIKLTFYNFWKCVQEKKTLPEEIELLEASLEFLEN
jgi:hypothetical protein